MMGLMLLLERASTDGIPGIDLRLGARHSPGEPAFEREGCGSGGRARGRHGWLCIQAI
jgi:hypothetical protein